MLTADECQTWRRYILPSAISVINFVGLPVKASTCSAVTAGNVPTGVADN